MQNRSSLLTLNGGVQIPAIGLGVFQNPPEPRVTARRLVGIWSKFQELDRRPIIQDERDTHPR